MVLSRLITNKKLVMEICTVIFLKELTSNISVIMGTDEWRKVHQLKEGCCVIEVISEENLILLEKIQAHEDLPRFS